MNLTFLDAGSLGPGLDLDRFSAYGALSLWEATRPEERRERLAGRQVVVSNRISYDRPLFEDCPELRLILLAATGFNTVDLDAARDHGVAVCNVVGYSTESVVQHTVALLLALMEQTAWLDRYGKTAWAGSTGFGQFARPFSEVAGKTWGIVGLGRIGRRVAEVAAALGARPVWASAAGSERQEAWLRLTLEDLLAQADIVSLHSPLNATTRGLLGAPRLGLLKPSAYLLNLGRGGLIDEDDLARRLDAGLLAGAALDVTAPEPPKTDSPLLHLTHPERLILSPHVGWASIESRERCLAEVELNLRAWLDGGRRNRVDETHGS